MLLLLCPVVVSGALRLEISVAGRAAYERTTPGRTRESSVVRVHIRRHEMFVDNLFLQCFVHGGPFSGVPLLDNLRF
jgi:hypothetical protein